MSETLSLMERVNKILEEHVVKNENTRLTCIYCQHHVEILGLDETSHWFSGYCLKYKRPSMCATFSCGKFLPRNEEEAEEYFETLCYHHRKLAQKRAGIYKKDTEEGD